MTGQARQGARLEIGEHRAVGRPLVDVDADARDEIEQTETSERILAAARHEHVDAAGSGDQRIETSAIRQAGREARLTQRLVEGLAQRREVLRPRWDRRTPIRSTSSTG